MSKEYWNYRDEDGETAYLAGALDVLSDRLSMYFDSHYTMDADIFRIRNNDISLLGDAVRRRLHSFLPEGIHLTGEEIDRLEFHLKKSVPENWYTMLDGAVSGFASHPERKAGVKEFLDALSWYLQKPQAVYSPERMPDRARDILGAGYWLLPIDYFFLAFDEYMVLILIGSAE